MKNSIEDVALDFRQWLRSEKKMQERSAGDVLSRVRRVSKMIGSLKHRTESELLLLMENVPEFNQCSIYIKSQLRRAVKLYCSFVVQKR